MLSTPPRRFACARLRGPYLTESRAAFSSTLTTPALNRRSVRWFAACACTPAARGLPSSHVQHGCSGYLRHKHSFAPSWRTVIGITDSRYPFVWVSPPMRPYPSCYRTAFAFSVIFYPLFRPPSLRSGYHFCGEHRADPVVNEEECGAGRLEPVPR
jgi:hypothetical protein